MKKRTELRSTRLNKQQCKHSVALLYTDIHAMQGADNLNLAIEFDNCLFQNHS